MFIRGPALRGSVVRGTLGDSVAWYVEISKNDIKVGGKNTVEVNKIKKLLLECPLRDEIEEISRKKVTALSGEVDKHSGKPFYQVFLQLDDGSEFLVDGENMGASDEYVNGSRITGKPSPNDKEIIDILINFIENADKKDLQDLPDSK